MTSVREQLTLKQDEFQSLVAKKLGMVEGAFILCRRNAGANRAR